MIFMILSVDLYSVTVPPIEMSLTYCYFCSLLAKYRDDHSIVKQVARDF